MTSGNPASCRINYHFVWIPKYRRKILVGPVAERFAALLREACGRLGIGVLSLEVRPDHVHLFVATPPPYAPSQIARWLKGSTSPTLREEFPHLRRTKTLWTGSYYVGTYSV